MQALSKSDIIGDVGVSPHPATLGANWLTDLTMVRRTVGFQNPSQINGRKRQNV
jgi:hypothetical protein